MKRLVLVGGTLVLTGLIGACNHPDKAAAIHKIEKDTGCTFLKEGPTVHGDTDMTVWVFQGVLYRREMNGTPLPVVWAVQEYPDNNQVSLSYRLSVSEAEVISEYLERQKKDSK